MFKHIMVPLDGSTLSEKALSVAATIAKATEAQVTLVHSVSTIAYAYVATPMGGGAYGQIVEGEVVKSTDYLNKQAENLRECGVANVDVRVLTSTPLVAITDSVSYGIDLIVMSTHGRTGLARTMWGSVADEVVRSVNVPVLLVSTHLQVAANGCAPAFRRILVPLDGSALAEAALPIAGALAEIEGAALVLMEVVARQAIPAGVTDNRDAKADMYLHKAAALVLPADVEYETVESGGDAGKAIVQIAQERDCDLIVMSTHGRSGFSRIKLGSVADTVISHALVPVLLLHGQTNN